MRMHHEIPVNVSAKRAWQVLAVEFSRISEWSSALNSSYMDEEPKVGAIRTCQLNNGFGPIHSTEIKEQITRYDPKHLMLEYEVISGRPMFMTLARNRWTIKALDKSRCVVCSDAEITLFGPFKLLSPMLRLLMSSDMAIFFEELAFKLSHR